MPPGKNLASKEKTVGALKKVYILHGWTYSLDKWQTLIDLLKKNGLNPVLLKVPGLTQESDRVWDIEDYVGWLKKETETSDNLVLLGHSNGGRIALAFIEKYPQKVDHLILIDSAGIYHDELPIRFKRTLFKGLAKIGKKLTKSEMMKSLLYKVARESDYKNASPQMQKTLVNLLESDKNLRLDKIEVPTTIIWGGQDKTTPLSDGKIMTQKIKNSKLFIIKGAKHSPQYTHPEEVAEKIIEALKR
ncbi:MAG: alpha/beta hydrolase [bacterium]|nr:alpha/beta hydrolase [bacterium]